MSKSGADESTVLVCMRVTDIEPGVQSIIIKCDGCGVPVWLANSSPETDERICLQCLCKSTGLKNPLEIEPPTPKQIEDWKRR
jgi:recombinational DNA repair protein (RecF pathway)